MDRTGGAARERGAGAASIRLESVAKRYADGTVAVEGLTLDVAPGEVCVLVGPSGCGKTTTLKMINRLIEPTGGRILLDGEDVTHADPVALRRRMGYVIQHVGLFPHRTVEQNIATVPELLGWDRARVRARVAELLDMVGLEPATYAGRYPHALSGGQRQRVGVARALAADPPVLLMDEPFGAVDPLARDRLQQEFLRLQAALGKTVVLVTHDVEEAVRLADRIAVLSDGGRLEQHATPAEVLGAPASAVVAGFVGEDRGLKRLAVTPIRAADLVPAPGGVAAADEPTAVELPPYAQRGSATGEPVDGEPVLAVGDSLRDAMGALLRLGQPWVPVVDPATGAVLGGLTPAAVHSAALDPAP